MKRREGLLSTLVVVSLLFAACTGSSDDVADATVVPTVGAEPTEVEAATADPTPTVEVAAVGDEDLIAAAIARLDAEIASSEGPEATIAYDLLESSVDEDGFVTLRICAWTGETVFDTVRDSLYRTDVADDGTVTASHVTSPVGPGECLNSTLIDSALDFIDEFEAYWADVAAAPETFESDPRSELLLEDEYRDLARAILSGLVEDDLNFRPGPMAGDLRSRLEADPLFRRYTFDGEGLAEFVFCRPMNPAYGTYRDDVLIDDGGADDGPGTQSISAYQLEPNPASKAGWQMAGDEGLAWADCYETGDWVSAANEWRPRDRDLKVLEL